MPTGTLTNIGQHDWVEVTLNADQAYEFTVTGLSQSGEVILGTADGLSDDGLIATGLVGDSSGFGTTETQLTYFMPATSGTYYIDVSDPDALSASESYTVSAVPTTADDTDNPTHPATVAVGAKVSGTLTNIGQHDWVAVSLTADQAYEVTVTGLSEYAEVLLSTADDLSGDGSSALATETSQIGTGGTTAPDYIYFMPATTGLYDIDVYDLIPIATTETYTVAVAATKADYTDNPSAAASVTVGGKVSGTLANIGQHDWVAVNLVANQPYEISVTGLSEFADISIGTALGLADDGMVATGVHTGSSSAAQTQYMYFMPAASGTFYIDVADTFQQSGAEAYTVGVATTTADTTDNPTRPANLAIGGKVAGTLTNPGQHDWVAVTLTANTAYEFTVTGLSDVAEVTLGTAAALADDGDSASSFAALTSTNLTDTNYLYFMPSASGTYYLDLSDELKIGAAEKYSATLAVTTADYTDNPTGAAPPILPLNYNRPEPADIFVTGSLTNIGQHDWISMSYLQADLAAEVTVTGLSATGEVTLGTADDLAGDGLGATAISSDSLGLGGTVTHYAYIMAGTSDAYYADVSDPGADGPEAYTVTVLFVTPDVTDNPTHPAAITAACFAGDTRITTAGGEVAVQHLRRGDRIPAHFNPLGTVIWTGHRRIDCRRHPQPRDVWPVRVRRGAFGPDRPRRDLLLSPDHALFLEGVLIPVRCLINATTIIQEPIDRITYWHVELAAHDVILAEGLPAESYLDTGNRRAFDGPETALFPTFGRKTWLNACAPLCISGAAVRAARRRLAVRAARTGGERVQIIADGRRLHPARVHGAAHRFVLPAGTRRVCVQSEAPVESVWFDGRRLTAGVPPGGTLAVPQCRRAGVLDILLAAPRSRDQSTSAA